MARIHIYRSYRFLGQDPVIQKCLTMIRDEGLTQSDAALISDMSPATIKNWAHGKTRRPQFSSVASLTHSLGYEIDFKKASNKPIDVDEEKKAASAWKKRQEEKPAPKRVATFSFG